MSHDLGTDVVTFLSQLLQDTGERIDIVQNQAVGDEVVILDDFALFVAVVFGNQAVAAESRPLDELIEGFAFVGGRLNHPPDVGLGQEAAIRTISGRWV